MGRFFKKFGYAVFVLILASAVYFVLYGDKETKQDVIEFSLNMMGDKLMAMVPDSPEKQNLDNLYADFKQRALAGEVSSGEVESVAANILNASNQAQALTPLQAEGILRSGFMVPAALTMPLEPETEKGRPHQVPQPVPEEWDLCCERIQDMFAFNERAAKAISRSDRPPHEIMARHMQYRAEAGLNLMIDLDLKEQLEEEALHDLAVEIRALENKEMLKWKKEFQKEMKKEMEELKEELAELKLSLKEVEWDEEMPVSALEILEGLDALEHIPLHIPVHIGPAFGDSIGQIVKERLRAEGIEVE